MTFEAKEMIKPIPKVLLIIMLCMICVMPLLASDIYLPAMPNIALSLHTKETDIQLTLTAYLFGLAFCQLLYGPLSDIYGRRKILIIGIAIFIVASIACAYSKTLYQLIAFRFFQALGACSGMVISRAIAGDLYTRQEAAKVFTAIFPVVGASSAIAPIIGGYLTDHSGWELCFLFLSGFGIVILILTTCFLTETKTLFHKMKKPNHDLIITILKNRSFLGFTLIVSSAYSAYFSYIAASPFLFYRYGFFSHQIGYFFILLSVFYIAGNLIGRRIINFYPVNNAIVIGLILSVAGGILMVCVATIGTYNNPYALIIPMAIMTAGNGFLFPLGIASTVTLFPNAAGTASGLMGFLQLSTAAISVGIIGHLTNNQELPVALFITLLAAIASFSFYYFIYRGAYANEQI